jgi:hypothetical protein
LIYVDLEELSLYCGRNIGENLCKWFDSPLERVLLILLMEEMHQLLGI